MVASFTPCLAAIVACAYHSYCAFQNCPVQRMANSESRGGTLVLKRKCPPSFCASAPKTGACRNTANGPSLLNFPRGPDLIASTSDCCSPVSLSSASAGSRDNSCLACVFDRMRGEVFFCFFAILVL